MNDLQESEFGPVIYVYTRQQAIADGELVDVTEWASADKGFMGGFTCSVVFTRALWAVVDVDALPEAKRPRCQSTRGRAHDVLWMGSLALRGALARKRASVEYELLLTNGHARKARLRIVADSEGVTIGFPDDF